MGQGWIRVAQNQLSYQRIIMIWSEGDQALTSSWRSLFISDHLYKHGYRTKAKIFLKEVRVLRERENSSYSFFYNTELCLACGSISGIQRRYDKASDSAP